MDLGIKGKLAVVTGSSKGLGFGVCEALAAEGVNIMLFARNPQELEAAAQDLRQRFGVEAGFVAGDMTVKDDIVRLAKACSDRGGPDILVLNTARPPHPLREFLDETDPERWEVAYRTQLLGACVALQQITPLIMKKKWGRVIAITTASVKQPMPLHTLSTVFRAGVMGALKHLANEIAASGVTVNSISPAAIRSDAFAGTFDLGERARGTPMQRLGTVAELAGTVAFLASQQAGYIHGANIQVDGGSTAALY